MEGSDGKRSLCKGPVVTGHEAVSRNREAQGWECKGQGSSWRGKMGGAGRSLMLNLVGWINDWHFVLRAVEPIVEF